MISTTGKAMLTGLVFGAVGVLGGVWAAQRTAAEREPLSRLVDPGPLSVGQEARSRRAAHASENGNDGDSTERLPPTAGRAAAAAARHEAKPKLSKLDDRQGDDSSTGGALAIKRLVVTDRIEDREPVSGSEFRADGTQVFAFVELSNEGAEAQQIEIVFEHESGQQVGFVKLPVPKDSSRWRTWGKTQQIKRSGRWVAKVRGADGAELMSRDFVVGQG